MLCGCHAAVPSLGARASEKGGRGAESHAEGGAGASSTPPPEASLLPRPGHLEPTPTSGRLRAPGGPATHGTASCSHGSHPQPPSSEEEKREGTHSAPGLVFREASKSVPSPQAPCSPPLLLRTLSQPLTGPLPCTPVPSNSPRRSGHAPSCLGTLAGCPLPSK